MDITKPILIICVTVLLGFLGAKIIEHNANIQRLRILSGLSIETANNTAQAVKDIFNTIKEQK